MGNPFGELEWNYQKEAAKEASSKPNWGQRVKLHQDKITKRYYN
jgi:hypothetical protein